MKGEIYYFIGIGGIGMSALAKIVIEKGATVYGSDLVFNANTIQLQKMGAHLFSSQHPSQIPSKAKVVYSSSISKDHIERAFALQAKMPIYHRSELLALLLQEQEGILVTGTHGKTSTAALVTHTLLVTQRKPSFALGGVLISENTNGAMHPGRWFVVEADESDGSFLQYPGRKGIVTNLEFDHVDYWKSQTELMEAFDTFCQQFSNREDLIWCYDDPLLRKISPSGISYGFSKGADIRIVGYRQNREGSHFFILYGTHTFEIGFPLFGRHQALNATAVFILCYTLGIRVPEIKRAFSSFQGVKRRAEFLGEYNGARFYDDYAHHPTEIDATLQSFHHYKEGNGRLIVVFQPHRFSRTAYFLEHFATCFALADQLILTDTYGAGEDPIPEAKTEALLQKITNGQHVPVTYQDLKALPEYLKKQCRKGDYILTLGAGNITTVGREIVERTT